jgi:dTMP kinase
MLISFEGIDGCGKTSQIKLLESYLTSIGKDCKVFREPGGTELSENIREILLSTKNSLTAVSELLLFSAARNDLVCKIIEPALEKNQIIILDRFYDSTTAYQGYGRKIPIDFVNQINRQTINKVVPDISFYLDIPLKVSKKRCIGKQLDRMELAGDDFFERVILGYQKIATLYPSRIVKIDGTKSKEEISQTVNKKINQLLKKT